MSVHYPHPDNEQHHNDNINHWWATETNAYLQDRLRHLVVRANWNKRIVTRIKLTNNDYELHQHRFDRFIRDLKNIAQQLEWIGLQYNEKRIKSIHKSLIKIRNYDNNRYSK